MQSSVQNHYIQLINISILAIKYSFKHAKVYSFFTRQCFTEMLCASMHNCNLLSHKWLLCIVYEFPQVFCWGSYVRVCVFIYVCVAVDIDAAGLDPEESDPPPHQRSPKASPNTVISPLAREKRMPFFKKVKHADGRSLALHLSVTAASRRACVACRRPNVHASLLHSLFPISLSVLSLFLCILIFHTPFVCFPSSFPQLSRGISR